MKHWFVRPSWGILLTTLFVLHFLTACQNEPVDVVSSSHSARVAASNPAALEAVTVWNETAIQAISMAGATPDALSLIPETRLLALMNVAVHDALNKIHERYAIYALHTDRVANASAVAAISTAAHDVLVSILPTQKTYLDGIQDSFLSQIPDQAATKKAGITLGQLAASTILANRAHDGIALAQIPYVPGTNPGNYQFTAPFNGPPFNGFAYLPGLGATEPWVLTSGAQFRPTTLPYALNSPEYTAEFNEVKSLGAANSVTRTSEQTQIALFWVEDSPIGWHRIAQHVADKQKLDAWEYARLFALLHMTIADSYTASFEAKYHFSFWRPVTAIHLADTDGNPNTIADPAWQALAPPTPPIPDYPSGHATAGAAAAELLKLFFGKDNLPFSTTSTSLSNVTRTYTSFTQAAQENAASRVYVGYHFRQATTEGITLGRSIGSYVFNHSLQ